MKAVLPDAADIKAKIAVRTKLRMAAREQLPTLVVPPHVLEVMEASLHADVAERPRDAAAMMEHEYYRRSEFGEWCDSIRVGANQVRARAQRGGQIRKRARSSLGVTQSPVRRPRRSTRRTRCATR